MVLGPTASGKSDVAMAYARRHPGAEIVAVDSMQVYRGMDIGTAKPTEADRANVPHHGLDLADPGDDWSVTQYTAVAQAALADIAARGGRAVLVAGTGLYLRALTDPMEVPGQWPEVRAVLEAREQQVHREPVARAGAKRHQQHGNDAGRDGVGWAHGVGCCARVSHGQLAPTRAIAGLQARGSGGPPGSRRESMRPEPA